MKRFVVFLFGIFLSAISYADTCTQSQIDLGNGECVDTKFSLTTSSTDSFNFNMSASGTFYIDCGNGGTLSSTADDVSDKTVVRNNTDTARYTCTWQSADSQTIRFAGAATGYNTSTDVATISFNSSATAEKLAAISGSLGAIFGTLGQSNGRQPRFTKTFEYSQITTIPPELFSGITGSTERMFNSTFKDCQKLTTIPSGLFQNITAAPSLFSGTFYNSRIRSIPEDLFSNITRAQVSMFSATFYGCSALQSIPENLFANVSGAANNMFYATFGACHSLTTIPEKLFAGINGCATYLFYKTFYGCNRLASLPENLFSGINCSASNMFKETFLNVGVLSGYIPPSAFGGLIANSSPTATDMWLDTFSGTQLDTTCPTGTTEVDTGYKTAWGGKVSCVEDAPHVCSAGEYLPKLYNSCTICPSGNACVGGTYTFNETTDQGIVACASGTFAPSGSAVCYPHILHVGNDSVYLRSEKQTIPSLNIKIGNDTFYANMTTERTRMSKDSSHYLHVKTADNIHYYVCDDTMYQK